MSAPHHLLQLVPNRAKAAVDRLQRKVWERITTLEVSATEPTAEHRCFTDIANDPRSPVQQDTAWGRLYDQRWFHIEIPTGEDSGNYYLEWRDQGEATLYINGEPYYGFDVGHRYAKLPSGVKELWVEGYCLQSAIWHPEATGLSKNGAIFGGAWLVKRNDVAWEGYNDLKCLYDLMIFQRTRQHPPQSATLSPFGIQQPLQKVSPAYRQLLRWLDNAINALDTNGIEAMRKVMAQAYEVLRDKSSPITATLLGHAHIDLVWLWPERVGEAKAVHTFSTMDYLMSIYPEFRFSYSQPASYEAVEKRSPALMNRVKKRIASGTWEATGALYVESDTLIACGEALARSFSLGQEGFEKINGKPSRLLWLPDVFGYSACMPQLMKQNGVDYFFTTKLTWSAINHFPYSSFVWKGNDGSEVVAHVTQGVGYNSEVLLPQIFDNAEMHAQADIHPEFAHPTGLGDGGGGVTEEMCERARRLTQLSGTPKLEWDQPEAFFERLGELKDSLPVWQGECYLEYHRGTYTTHTHLKAIFRQMERALQIREAAAALSGTNPDLITEWKKIVFAQFHDYIPGSSVMEVYLEDLPLMQKMAEDLVKDSSTELSNGAEKVIFNPHATDWKGLWIHPETSEEILLSLPPLAVTTLEKAQKAPSNEVKVDGHSVSNGKVSFSIGADGSLTDVIINGRELRLDKGAGQPITYPDLPANFESWDIDRQTLDIGTHAGAPEKIEASGGGLSGSVAVTWKLCTQSSLTLTYSLTAESSHIDVTADLDWQEGRTLLQLAFPTLYKGQQARFGAPFGSILRGQQPGPLSTEAQWEVPASRWAAVFNDGEREGMFIATEAKYGFAVKNGRMTLTLARSPYTTGCELEAHAGASPRGLSRHTFDSPYADTGKHQIRYAIGFYDAGCNREDHPAALADSLYTQPILLQGTEKAAGLNGLKGGESLIPAWVQPAGKDAWILRLHEVSGHSGKAELDLAEGYSAETVDLRQQAVADKLNGKTLRFEPYEIVSVKITKA